ncbi:MAG: hypothetical protein JW881_21355 [Spirochaetales bacterium]|nr:hypothetical protein [Spirochaetales bacterium]
METTIYRYSDGSGNSYVIRGNSIEYIPVQPSFSSSGIYSGGERSVTGIMKADYKRLVSLFERAIENTSVHIGERRMGSGYIEKETDGRRFNIIVEPDSNARHEIEDMLRKLVAKGL